jgi:hypothetical protein
MHIHRTPVDLNISNLYNAEAARKAAEAKKAAEVRRKLLRASASIGDETQDFEGLVVSQREGDGSGQDRGGGSQAHYALDADQSRTPRKAADEQPEKPLSIWA